MTVKELKRKAEGMIRPTAKAWLAPMESEILRLIDIANNGTPEELADAVRSAAKDSAGLYDKLDKDALAKSLADLQAEAVLIGIRP